MSVANKTPLPYEEALEKLKNGNLAYLTAISPGGDISPARRKQTAREGQFPYAAVLTCADSRVIPESIFQAGLGELFVVRVAGNVACETAIGSVEYALRHLKVRLVLVLGHTGCGAVGAALHDGEEGYIGTITREIQAAIGSETREPIACRINAERAAEKLKAALCADRDETLKILAAVYDIETGKVEFLPESS